MPSAHIRQAKARLVREEAIGLDIRSTLANSITRDRRERISVRSRGEGNPTLERSEQRQMV